VLPTFVGSDEDVDPSPLSLREALEARWLDLTRRVLPGLAVERGWPIRRDHCFQRVLLDATFGGVWYAHVARRPAYRVMSDVDLARATELAESAATNATDVFDLNARSLAYRGKLAASERLSAD